MNTGLSGVGRSTDPSVPELLFQEHRAGRLAKEDYETQTAVWVAENAHQYEFRSYPTLSQVVVEYVHARAGGKRETRDPSFHRRVGNWTEAIRQRIDQNSADHELFLWCREKLLAKGLVKHVETLEVKSQEYMHAPPAILSAANRCQYLDWQEKMREIA